MLNGDSSIRITYVIFDLLGLDGTNLTQRPYEERRSLLEVLDLEGPYWNVTEVFDDGEALYRAVCELGLEGVVAKRRTSRYGTNVRGWVKVRTQATGGGRASLRARAAAPSRCPSSSGRRRNFAVGWAESPR
jgi:ATP-dependent DNA ligase